MRVRAMASRHILLLAAGIALACAEEKFNGLCYASWTSQGSSSYDADESDASIALAAKTGIDILAITNTYYQDNQNSTDISESTGVTGKSNTDSGVKRAVAAARKAGLKVAIKPHVDFLNDPSHWRGQIGPTFTEVEWQKWFSSYVTFISHMAQLAKDVDADLFIIGTELSTTIGQDAAWRNTISVVRKIVGDMPLTYAANWGCGGGSKSETLGPGAVAWWDALDYIGVDAYYPLATKPSEPVTALEAAWSNSPTCGDILGNLKNISDKFRKPVLFTELGYTTTDACAVGNHAGGNLDMQAQADAYTAFFNAVYSQTWVSGVFFWDWETNPHGGGRCDGGAFSFTPKGKLAEDVMRTYFKTAKTIKVESQAAAIPVYDNGRLGSGWQDWSYNCQKSLKGTGHVYPGQKYSAHASCTNWGALSFHASNAFRSDGYGNLTFVIHSSKASGDQVQVALYGTEDPSHPFPADFASHFVESCHLSTDGWTLVSIPMSELLPPSGWADINRVEFKANYASGVGEIWIDKVAFVLSAGPTPGPGCEDHAPDTQYTCAEQKSWGKCSETWMKGYCCNTCFICAKGCGSAYDHPLFA